PARGALRMCRFRFASTTGAVALVLSIASTAARAQGGHDARLFVAARALPLVAQSMTVSVEGGDAVVELVQVFANDGDGVAQADYRLHLPGDDTREGFG